MEFGRLGGNELGQIDYTLTPDGASIAKILSGKPMPSGCKFHVGCAKWGRKDWKGHLYPERMKESEFLSEYAKHFDTIELNASFYSIPSAEQVTKWRKQVEDSGNGEFLFLPRISRSISIFNDWWIVIILWSSFWMR